MEMTASETSTAQAPRSGAELFVVDVVHGLAEKSLDTYAAEERLLKQQAAQRTTSSSFPSRDVHNTPALDGRLPSFAVGPRHNY